MGTFSLPPGDPDRLDDLAGQLATLSERVGVTRCRSLDAASTTAVEALPTARVADFSAASGYAGISPTSTAGR